jgi:hypothetical protein
LIVINLAWDGISKVSNVALYNDEVLHLKSCCLALPHQCASPAWESFNNVRLCKKGVQIWEHYHGIGTQLKLENTQPKYFNICYQKVMLTKLPTISVSSYYSNPVIHLHPWMHKSSYAVTHLDNLLIRTVASSSTLPPSLYFLLVFLYFYCNFFDIQSYPLCKNGHLSIQIQLKLSVLNSSTFPANPTSTR